VTTGRLRALFAAEGIAFGLSMPFLVPLLDDRGLDARDLRPALPRVAVDHAAGD
jgi:hypothetical protein